MFNSIKTNIPNLGWKMKMKMCNQEFPSVDIETE